MRGDLGERAERAGVALDRDHLARALREQRAGEAARTGADFDHRDALERAASAGDLPGQVEVEQEVLAERLARLEPVRRDHFAQARQAVRGQRLRRLEGLSRTRRAGADLWTILETRGFARSSA